MGYFSPGIEPVAGDGAAYRLGPGRVAFKPIASLPAGEEVKLTIPCGPPRPGNHVFRAEVHCQRPGNAAGERTDHALLSGRARDVAGVARLPPPPADGQPQGQPPRTADGRLSSAQRRRAECHWLRQCLSARGSGEHWQSQWHTRIA